MAKPNAIQLVHNMLNRHLVKDKKFRKWMKKVDQDENGCISAKEWGKLLVKMKKKDDSNTTSVHHPLLLTSQVAVKSFKMALSAHPRNRTSNNELTLTGLRNWVFGEPHPPTHEELAEIKIQQVINVRNCLAEEFEDQSGFYQWMERIDQDESGTVSAEEFLSLMMMIQYNPLQGQHASDLTIELSTDCWNAVLARESEQHMCYSKKNKEEREIHFASLKSWIFQRELTPNALRSWSTEGDAEVQIETETVKGTRFTSAKDVFVYLDTVNHIVIEQLDEGQYLVSNCEDKHPFLLLEERSDFWCNMLCYPAHPFFFKFYNPSRPFKIPAKKGSCCGGKATKESIYFQARGNNALMTFERSGLFSNCSQMPFFAGIQNCIVLGACCQSETWMHAVDIPMETTPISCCIPRKGCLPYIMINGISYKSTKGSAGNCDKSDVFGHSQVPVLGGMFTPTVNLMQRSNESEESEFGVVTGPTFFGGCLSMCCDTHFEVKKNDQSLGMITKMKGGMGLEFSHGMTDHDIELSQDAVESCCVKMGCGSAPGNTLFDVNFTENEMTPEQKAIMIGEVIHLDYLFFENEEPPLTIEGCGICSLPETCICILCNFYCCGALLPIRLKLCEKEGDEGMLEVMAEKLKERVAGK